MEIIKVIKKSAISTMYLKDRKIIFMIPIDVNTHIAKSILLSFKKIFSLP